MTAAKKWQHDELQNDLAAHLRASRDRVIWTDMQLGPSGSPRPDVFAMPKTYSRFKPLAYECKISVADFRRDIIAGKWQSYLKFASGVIFAVPAGLIKKEDVPAGCGLIVRHEEIWRMVKGPTLRAIDSLPHEAWMKLMIDGLGRQHHDLHPRDASPWSASEAVRRKYGEHIGAALRDLNLAEQRLQDMRARAERSTDELRREAEEHAAAARRNVERELQETGGAKRELCEALGLLPETPMWKIVSAAHEAGQRLAADGEVRRLRQKLDHARKALDEGLAVIPMLSTDQRGGQHADV